jgi:hypothetical protein
VGVLVEYRFNPPPNWPTPPEGWYPPEGWMPDPAWGQAPADWQYWVPVTDPSPGKSPASTYPGSGHEATMHARLAERRVNLVNRRREFFYATPEDAKRLLVELAGNLLQYEDLPEALEYRQSVTQRNADTATVA